MACPPFPPAMTASETTAVTTLDSDQEDRDIAIAYKGPRNTHFRDIDRATLSSLSTYQKSRHFALKAKIRLLTLTTILFGTLTIVLLITTVLFAVKSRNISPSQELIPCTTIPSSGTVDTTMQIASTTTSPPSSTVGTTMQITSTTPATTTSLPPSTVGTTTQIISSTNTSQNPDVSEQCYSIKTSLGWKQASKNILNSIDFSADPCQDFYQYACGVWALKNPLPHDRSSYTIYSAVRERVSNDTRAALDSIDINSQEGIPEAIRKLKVVYDLCVNESKGETLKGIPIVKFLADSKNEIGPWPAITPGWKPRKFNPEKLIGNAKRLYGIDTVIFTYGYAYALNSSESILQLSGGMLPLGLGIFTAQYYLNDTLYGKVMGAYLDLMKVVGELLTRDAGLPPSAVNYTDFQSILQLEKKIAAAVNSAAWDINKWNVSYLKSKVQKFNWDTFFHALLPEKILRRLYKSSFEVEVMSPEFLNTVADLLYDTDPRTVQNYVIWRLIKYSLPFLSSEYRDALQNLTWVMTGSSESLPRWQSCIGYIKGRNDLPGLGYATGRVFVDRYFPKSAKIDVKIMIKSIIWAFEGMVDKLRWMDEKTKSFAIQKAKRMKNNVAFPDWILLDDRLNSYYANLNITVEGPKVDRQNMALVNLLIRGWAARHNFLSLSEPYDKKQFGGPPSATDAWYSSPSNSLTIPAGELQAPFYAQIFPRAVNFGAIGAVIGHEMTHGFDSSGSQYDAQGNLHDWWSKSSKKAFENRTKCLIDQFSKFCYPHLDLCVNGGRTVAENIADLGGLKAAFLAYQNFTFQYGAEPKLPGLESFSMDQIFFLSFASFWCGNATPQSIRNSILTNAHTPDKYRVIGTLQNLPEFAQAFHCPKGAVMNPTKKCTVW